MMKKTNIVKKLMLAAVMFPLAAQAAQAAEMASFGEPPKDFKIGYQTEQNGMVMVELVPQKQTVDNWTKMITLQSMAGAKPGVAAFGNNLSTLWKNTCPGGSFDTVQEGKENGYPFALWMMACENNPSSNKPELTWVKAVQGNDGLYVKQYAFRYAPNDAEITNAMGHLRNLIVCDNSAKHPCGKNGK
ncbi:hypothetical protein [Neisseria elongata]|jgi:hypothetical protein|nr:hypothetical protein [Neisseria elongata]